MTLRFCIHSLTFYKINLIKISFCNSGVYSKTKCFQKRKKDETISIGHILQKGFKKKCSEFDYLLLLGSEINVPKLKPYVVLKVV